jgi:hypothetical protein
VRRTRVAAKSDDEAPVRRTRVADSSDDDAPVRGTRSEARERSSERVRVALREEDFEHNYFRERGLYHR